MVWAPGDRPRSLCVNLLVFWLLELVATAHRFFVVDYLVRGLMRKHEDHVRVLEALIYNQETLVNLKDAKIEELENGKQQLQFHVTKLQDSQLFFDVSNYSPVFRYSVIIGPMIRWSKENKNVREASNTNPNPTNSSRINYCIWNACFQSSTIAVSLIAFCSWFKDGITAVMGFYFTGLLQKWDTSITRCQCQK